MTSEVEKEDRRRRVRESQEEEIMQEDKGYMIGRGGGEASSRRRRWRCFPPSVPTVLLHTPSALESVRSELIPCALYFLSLLLLLFACWLFSSSFDLRFSGMVTTEPEPEPIAV